MIKAVQIVGVLMISSATFLNAQETKEAQRLQEQGKQLEEKIVQMADNVYTSVGTSVSNVSMIIGNDGVVIVDTGPTRLRKSWLSSAKIPTNR